MASPEAHDECQSWSTFGNSITCDDPEPSPLAQGLAAYIRNGIEEDRRNAALEVERQRLLIQQQQQQAYAQQQAFLQQQQMYAAQQEQSFLAVVSQAVQQGQCEDAKAIALSRGRLDIAEQAARLCSPPQVNKTQREKRR